MGTTVRNPSLQISSYRSQDANGSQRSSISSLKRLKVHSVRALEGYIVALCRLYSLGVEACPVKILSFPTFLPRCEWRRTQCECPDKSRPVFVVSGL